MIGPLKSTTSNTQTLFKDKQKQKLRHSRNAGHRKGFPGEPRGLSVRTSVMLKVSFLQYYR